jgi:hypothetical protein
MEFVPEHLQGTVVVGVIMLWCGPVDQAEQAFAPVLGFGTPLATVTMPVPYAMFQSMLDDPPGFRNYWSGEYLPTLPDEGIEVWARYGRTQRPSPTQLVLFPWGGAVARDPGTAMSTRGAQWVFHPLCLWEDAADDAFWIDFARSSRREMAAFGLGTSYANFHSDIADDQVVAAFGPERYARLAAVKARFDPDNVFHLNANIKPA